MARAVDKLIAAAPLRSEVVEIEGFGPLTVRELSFSERQEYSEACRGSSVAEGLVFALSRCVDGLEDITQSDLDKIAQGVVDEITNTLFGLSGLLADAVDDAEGN